MRNNDLLFCKNLLLARQRRIQQNIDDAIKEIDSIDMSDAKEEADIASYDISIAIDQTLNVKQYKELAEIEHSLAKFEKGSYGICEMCEEEISIKRLKVKPHAKYCIICREISEKMNKK